VPCPESTRTTVVEIVLDSRARHLNAEQIQRQHPHHTMGQIHAALGSDPAPAPVVSSV